MSMIDRVRNAILLAYEESDDPNDMARAAIEAMMEPTEAMIKAADLSERDWAIETCRNIIAAALTETPKP